ncbi:hypothetical protein [Anaerotruncus colihominis]|uniref:hypothetical protein n=1 Tax=Anaerotruncus colihominis TaxID=169435 RepID=UPI000B3A07F8|nr:hypothetical protein [Anaerotruncus colihominis]OUO68672.1 hypothetical protein B5F55_00145 [Anaerotruncus colihominis]
MAGNKKSVEDIIKESVNAAVSAAQRGPKDTYKATERRLYAYPYLKQKLEDDREMLAEVKTYGPREKSKSIVRFQKNGGRLTPDEIFDAVVLDLEATIAADEEEIRAIEKAVSYIEGDRYAYSVTGKYFKDLDDETIAKELECEPTTIWRHRKRLVQRISVMLYGAQAVK